MVRNISFLVQQIFFLILIFQGPQISVHIYLHLITEIPFEIRQGAISISLLKKVTMHVYFRYPFLNSIKKRPTLLTSLKNRPVFSIANPLYFSRILYFHVSFNVIKGCLLFCQFLSLFSL